VAYALGAPRLEQSAKSSKKSLVKSEDDAQYDAQMIELALIIDRWPSLSNAARVKIVSLVAGLPK
jgi:hypothetical protein